MGSPGRVLGEAGPGDICGSRGSGRPGVCL